MNNKVFLYNNSFLNLLTLIDNLITKKIKPYNIKNKDYNKNLLDEIIDLDIIDNKEVIKKVIKSSSLCVLKIMYYVFLSNEKDKELIIYYLYLNTLKYKNHIINMRNLKCVNKSLKIAKYVSKEAHHLKGFLRFKELKNHVLYAEMEPTNNVISILSIHFKKRLKNEYWIIKDNKRDILSIYDKKNYYIIDTNSLIIDLDIDNNNYEELWCSFYNSIGIKERKNDKCRMNFMPKKYWKYIIEMSEEYEESGSK